MVQSDRAGSSPELGTIYKVMIMAVNDSQKLKRLQTDKAETNNQLQDLRQTQQTLNEQASKLTLRLKSINKDIEKLTKKDVVVSEHALLRYIERVYGIDLEEIKEEILGDGRRSMIEFAKNGKFKIKDKHELVVKNSVVITIQ